MPEYLKRQLARHEELGEPVAHALPGRVRGDDALAPRRDGARAAVGVALVVLGAERRLDPDEAGAIERLPLAERERLAVDRRERRHDLARRGLARREGAVVNDPHGRVGLVGLVGTALALGRELELEEGLLLRHRDPRVERGDREAELARARRSRRRRRALDELEPRRERGPLLLALVELLLEVRDAREHGGVLDLVGVGFLGRAARSEPRGGEREREAREYPARIAHSLRIRPCVLSSSDGARWTKREIVSRRRAFSSRRRAFSRRRRASSVGPSTGLGNQATVVLCGSCG